MRDYCSTAALLLLYCSLRRLLHACAYCLMQWSSSRAVGQPKHHLLHACAYCQIPYNRTGTTYNKKKLNKKLQTLHSLQSCRIWELHQPTCIYNMYQEELNFSPFLFSPPQKSHVKNHTQFFLAFFHSMYITWSISFLRCSFSFSLVLVSSSSECCAWYVCVCVCVWVLVCVRKRVLVYVCLVCVCVCVCVGLMIIRLFCCSFTHASANINFSKYLSSNAVQNVASHK